MSAFVHFLVALLAALSGPAEATAERPPAPSYSPIQEDRSDLWNEGCAAGRADADLGLPASALDSSEWSEGYADCYAGGR